MAASEPQGSQSPVQASFGSALASMSKTAFPGHKEETFLVHPSPRAGVQVLLFPSVLGYAKPFLPHLGLSGTRTQLRFALVTEHLSKDFKPFHPLHMYGMGVTSIRFFQQNADL